MGVRANISGLAVGVWGLVDVLPRGVDTAECHRTHN